MDSDSEEVDLSPEEQEAQNRLLQALERARTISMTLNYVEHLLNPEKPYTPGMNTPSVRALLNEVNPGKTVETRRDAIRKLQEKLAIANKEYEEAIKEAEKFSR
ncbi:hypothetical protein ACNAW0_24490 [Micromonospora sp. SL1-18]|uniref:hypothetical protein n=1 Tax=Micromonospora sp. SL1-18 TaxID=3399128 RepID=UPI003A4DAF91